MDLGLRVGHVKRPPPDEAAAAGVSRHSEEGPTAEMELLPLPPCATAAPPGFSVIANRLISAGRLLSIRRQVA